MELEFFARGLVIGFAIAAPVGPIGMLVIRRTLADGRLLAFSRASAPPWSTASTAASAPSV